MAVQTLAANYIVSTQWQHLNTVWFHFFVFV